MDFDSIDEKRAFKLGFAAYCADNKLTPQAAAHLATKAASGWGENLGLLAVGLPAAVGLVGGGALGMGAAKMDEPSTTPEDIKAKEIQDTYKRYTDRLKARRAYQQYRAARQIQ
jgi:alanine dehydrogenase